VLRIAAINCVALCASRGVTPTSGSSTRRARRGIAGA